MQIDDVRYFQEIKDREAHEFTVSSKMVARVTALPYKVDPSYMNYTMHTVRKSGVCDLSDLTVLVGTFEDCVFIHYRLLMQRIKFSTSASINLFYYVTGAEQRTSHPDVWRLTQAHSPLSLLPVSSRLRLCSVPSDR